MAAAPPFVVNVADLLYRPGARRRVQLSGPVDEFQVLSSRVPGHTVVDVDALLEWVSDGVLASGTATGPWVGECRRCLTPVEGQVTADFRELFEPHSRHGVQATQGRHGVQAPQAGEGETYPLRGDRIDLAPLAREVLLLELPLAPLCRDDCAGLCAVCGADLNAGPCGCAPADRDLRWAALDELLGDGGG